MLLLVFPASYLERVLKHANNLKTNFAWLKTFPVSELGLDICDPAQRVLIFQAMVAITQYVGSGKARTGMWI